MSDRKFPSIFIVASACVALNEEKDSYHKKAKTFIRKIKDGEYNFVPIHTSEFILLETYTYLNYNYNYRAEVDIVDRIKDSNLIIHPFSSIQFDDIWKNIKDPENELSFVDGTTVRYMEKYDIHHIFSFDSDFSKFNLLRYP